MIDPDADSAGEPAPPPVPSTGDGQHLDTERVTSCPVCGGRATTPWRTGCRDWQQIDAPQRFDYARCCDCGSRFMTTRAVEAELGKVYFPGYGPYLSAPSTPRAVRAHPLARIASYPAALMAAIAELAFRDPLPARLDQHYAPDRRGQWLVDYGCGAPTFLDEARARGWETIGVDFSDAVLDQVRARGHQAHLVGHAFEHEVPDGSVACVRMNHVIEHLYDPVDALASIRRKLVAGGRIHVATPNPASGASRVFGRRWFSLDCPRHVVLYEPRVARQLLVGAGFRDPEIVHEVGSKDIARSWGIVLFARGRIAHAQIASLAADADRDRMLRPTAKLAALVGIADRYHAFAHT